MSARRLPERTFAWAAVVLTVLVAFGLRAFRIGVSWDAFIDEINYLQISQGVLRTLWVYGNDGPFYLHPPLFFFLEAAYMKIFGIDGDLIHQLYGVRYLGAAFAGLSAGALLWSGWRLAGWPAGIAAAALFALDPFLIDMNSHNMLDTPTGLWVLLGYGVLFPALVREDHRPVSWRRTVVAGVLFGLALLTKEVSAFVTLLPLGMCFVLGWALPRTRSVVIGVVALIVYAPYPINVYAIGHWDLFLEKKFDGVSRLAGLVQFTGFNQPGGPSFLNALVSKLDELGTTYALLATGAVAVCVLLLTGLGKARAHRLLVSWALSAYALLAYITVFGTLEHQFFYYLLAPSILVTAVTTALVLREMRAGGAGRRPAGYAAPRPHAARRSPLALEATAVGVFVGALVLWNAFLGFVVVLGTLEHRLFYYLLAPSILVTAVTTALVLREMRAGGAGRRPAGYAAPRSRAARRRRLVLEAAAAVFVGALVLWNSYLWVELHTVPDNGYQRVMAYVEELPEGSRVAVTSQVTELLIPEHAGEGKYESVSALQADNIDYVVMNEELVNEGWEEPPPEVYRWVRDHGQLVYGFINSRSSGIVGVWRLQDHAQDTTSASEVADGGSGARGAR